MADPFTEIHNAIWSTLEASTDFTDLVPAANRIKLTSKRQSMDGLPRHAHEPMVTVYPDNGRSEIICSSATTIKEVWLFDVWVGDDRVTADYFPVKWAIFRAMAAASLPSSTLRSALTFSDANVIMQEFTNFDDKHGLFTPAGTIKGWRTMWAYEVTMQFKTASLAPS